MSIEIKIIDLSHDISSDMAVYPGAELPKIKKLACIEENGYRERKFTFSSHIGTHIDAPSHMLKNGHSVTDLNINHFFGNAVLVNLVSKYKSVINIEDFIPIEDDLEDTEFLIIMTEWSKHWGSEEYFNNYPVLSEEAAKWLCGFKLKGVGIDAISFDKFNSENLIIHKTFFASQIILIENLTNLNSIPTRKFNFACLPLKIHEADGSPVRAIAIID